MDVSSPSWVVRAARRLAATVSDMNYAVERLTALQLARGVEIDDHAPQTYAEFLLRTTGTLRHEPSARQRADGHQVR
jgi:hypothetical protein